MHINQTVHLRGLKLRTRLKVTRHVQRGLFQQHIQAFAHLRLPPGRPSVGQHGRQLIVTPSLNFVGHLLRHCGRRRILLRGILKNPGPIQLRRCGKIQQLLKIRLCFTRKTHHKSGAQSRIRQIFPDFGQKLLNAFPVKPAVHSAQHRRAHVLQRQIQIMANCAAIAHSRQQLLINALRVSVKQAQHTKAQLVQLPQKLWQQRLMLRQIPTVSRGVLSNQTKLLHAGRFQASRLRQQLIQRLAAQRPANVGYRAKGTTIAAPLGNFQIRCVGRG